MSESPADVRPSASKVLEHDMANSPQPVVSEAPGKAGSPMSAVQSSPVPSQTGQHENQGKARRTSESMLSRAAGSIRRASITFVEDAPTGLMAVAGNAAATGTSIADVRRGSVGDEEWSPAPRPLSRGQRSSSTSRSRRLSGSERRASITRRSSDMTTVVKEAPETTEQIEAIDHLPPIPDSGTVTRTSDLRGVPVDYTKELLPKLSWSTLTVVYTKIAFKWVFTTPKGFLLTLYMLNVTAWGAMLFFLLLKAAPAMCPHTKDGCNDFNSPRRKWMEIDMQILNAFFCLTGFGFAPWRFRDTWLLLQWRGFATREPKKREIALRRLAGIHRSWFRLQGSGDWKVDEPPRDEEEYNNDPTVPLPIKWRLAPPLSGVRAPPTAAWKMDFLVWNNFWNTIFQAFLAAFMWASSRRTRPPWTTAMFISLAFGNAIAAGSLVFTESRHIHKVEGKLPNPDIVAAQRKLLPGSHGIDLETGISNEKMPVGFAAALRRKSPRSSAAAASGRTM